MITVTIGVTRSLIEWTDGSLGAGGAVLVEAATGTAERSPAAGAGVCAHAATTSPADAASAATLRQHGARRGVDLLMN